MPKMANLRETAADFCCTELVCAAKWHRGRSAELLSQRNAKPTKGAEPRIGKNSIPSTIHAALAVYELPYNYTTDVLFFQGSILKKIEPPPA
jgi:hypothetical protein